LTKPVPKVYSTRFFQLITTRQFAEAERILERIKQKMHPSDRNRGYFQALYGMLLTMKNSDRYAFLPTLDLTDKKQLKNHRKEFLSHVERRLHDEYDRGYFEAWADYMKILPKMEATPSTGNSRNAVKQIEQAIEETESKNETKSAEDEREEKTARNHQSLLLDYPPA